MPAGAPLPSFFEDGLVMHKPVLCAVRYALCARFQAGSAQLFYPASLRSTPDRDQRTAFSSDETLKTRCV